MKKQPEHNPNTQPHIEPKQDKKEPLSPTNLQTKLHQSKQQGSKPHSETANQQHQPQTHHQKDNHEPLVHHHYHHVEPELIIKTKDLVNPSQYLMDIYKMEQKVDSYYMKNTQEYINYWKREYDINFTLDGWQLINYDIVINMEEFLKQNWTNLEYIGFSGCKIDDIKWRLFADHAELFPNLKWLSLQIKHTLNVKQGDLEKFKSLQRIQFKYQQWTHPLSIPSKNYLKTFAKSHPHVQVTFG